MEKSMKNRQLRARVLISAATRLVSAVSAPAFPPKTARIVRKLGLQVD